jgi:hypothetical protein
MIKLHSAYYGRKFSFQRDGVTMFLAFTASGDFKHQHFRCAHRRCHLVLMGQQGNSTVSVVRKSLSIVVAVAR